MIFLNVYLFDFKGFPEFSKVYSILSENKRVFNISLNLGLIIYLNNRRTIFR